MQPGVPSPATPDPTRGLPPVEPPTVSYLARQFLVPLLIVGSVLGLFALCAGSYNWFFGALFGTQTVEQALQNIDNANPEVRWRAANDLAQLLRADEKHATDPHLALDLTQRLQQAIEKNRVAEVPLLERLQKPFLSDPEAEAQAVKGMRKALKFERKYLLYLAACLGYVNVPTAASLLKEMAIREDAEPSAVILRRRQAVSALASLGERVGRFPSLPPEKQTAILDGLREEAKAGGDRGRWAEEALRLLEKGESPGVEAALAASARSRDPYLRKVTALALTFWPGPGTEEALEGLTHDGGDGDDQTGDEDEDTRDGERRQPHPQGLYREEIQQQAVQALAMRGSSKIEKYLPRLADMLDEDKQREAFRVTVDGQEVIDPDVVAKSIENAMRAVAELHRKRPDLDLAALDSALEKLTHSSSLGIQTAARRTRAEIREGK
jgi:hypothetical protein